MPALLTKTSREPVSSITFLHVSVAAAKSSARATKPFNCEFSESTASRFSCFLDVIYTFQPCSINFSAVERPIPLVPPVTSAVFIIVKV